MSVRIDAFLDGLRRLNVDDLLVLSVEPMDRAVHDRLLDEADAAAVAAGRRDELAEAADRARDQVVRAIAFRGYEPTWFGLNWGRSLGRADDRAALIGAVEDAAIASVVADLAPDTADALRAPFELVVSMAGSSPLTNPSSTTHRNTVRVVWVLAALGLLIGAGVALAELVAGFVQ
jgi:hypothetical protein